MHSLSSLFFSSFSILSLVACSADSAGTKSSNIGDTGTIPSGTTSSEGGENLPGSGSTSDPYTGAIASQYVCSDLPVEGTWSQFGHGNWYPEGTEPGTACTCSYTYTGDGTTYRLRMDSLRIIGDNTDGSPGRISATTTFFGGDAGALNADPVNVGGYWEAYPITDTWHEVATTLSGTYSVWLSELELTTVGTGAPAYNACSAYPGPIWEFSNLVESSTDQAAGTEVVVGETSTTCSASTAASASTTVFHLGGWARGRGRAPYYQSGNQKFGGSLATSIQVTDWGGATYLQVVGDGVETTLMDKASHALASAAGTGDYWTGSVGYYSDGSPTISVGTSCAATPTSKTRPQGYSATLDTLTSLLSGQAATDGKKPDTNRKAPLVFRVVPDLAHNSTTANLFVELAGTNREVGIPMMRVNGSSTSYTVSYAGPTFKVAGKVSTSSTGMTLALTSASFVGYSGSWVTLSPSKSSVTLKKVGP